MHRTKKVLGKGLELLGGFYQPSQHRVRIDLKDPRRGTNASAFGSARQDAHDPLHGDLLPMKDRAMMLRKIAFARGAMELSSQVQPLVLVFEDLHWIDSETQALLNNLHGSQGPCRLVPQTSYDHSVDNLYIIFSGPMNTRIPPPLSTLPIERFWQWLKAKVYGATAFNTMEDVFRQIRQRIWHYHEGWLTSTIHWAFTLYQEI